MNAKLNFYLSDLAKEDQGALEQTINELCSKCGFDLPNDYLDIMREFNGGEGKVGENSWLCLFSIEDLIQVNQDYYPMLMEYIPEYFLFGKDAADTGYAFYKPDLTYHSFGLMCNFRIDPIEFCGRSFEEFVENLYKAE